MTKIPEEAQKVFDEVKAVVFLTAQDDGQPNGNIVAMKKIVDEGTVYLSDQFFNKTLANLKENQKVAILFWNAEGAYEIYGTARYVDEGEEFETQAAWVNAAFEKMGMPVKAKGGAYVAVEAVYDQGSGEGAGKKIA